MNDQPMSQGTIFEIIQVGNSLKMSAIDVETGIEVSIVMPVNADQSYGRSIAYRKLQNRLLRESKDNSQGGVTG